ncbi:MAG TPA: molybdopterin-binding protein, partial [Fimbriimonadaceae bacterium]|nr:molybdopterin-binding protein [Fimbriimonadaceae bacterium]
VLTMYDMLKMLDDDMEIVGVRLLEKRGGKSDFPKLSDWTARVIVASDRAMRGDYQDVSGEVLREGLEGFGGNVSKVVVADEISDLRRAIEEGRTCDLILITGGTGLGSRDITPETVVPMLGKRLNGVEEALRSYGQIRFPQAMLSRSIAGVIGNSVVVALPGSPSACHDAMNALFPSLLHAIEVTRG